MPTTATERLLVLLPAGLGLLAVGVAFLAWPRAGRAARVGIPLAVAAVVAGWLAAVAEPGFAAVAGTGTLAFVAVAALVGADWLAAVAARVRRPSVRWAAVAALGVATTVAAVAQYEYEPDELVADELAESPPLEDVPGLPNGTLLTDRGTAVVAKRPVEPADPIVLARTDDRMAQGNDRSLYMIRRRPAFEQANCHGFVFAAGRYWIGGNGVDSILTDNRYLPTDSPRPGDVIVYRTNGSVTHSGFVRYVTPGQPVLVESKWGRLGVYLHPADQSCYGAEYTFYRTARDDHTLTGATGG